jgi:hypothetical protein
MNPDSNDPAAPNPEPAPGPSPKTTQEKLDELSNTLTEAILKGGRDAKRAFDEGMPKVKGEFAKGLHDVAYAVGYAATFGAALLREATPDSLREGLRNGAASGRKAADEVMRQRREKAERGTTAPGDGDTEGAWA